MNIKRSNKDSNRITFSQLIKVFWRIQNNKKVIRRMRAIKNEKLDQEADRHVRLLKLTLNLEEEQLRIEDNINSISHHTLNKMRRIQPEMIRKNSSNSITHKVLIIVRWLLYRYLLLTTFRYIILRYLWIPSTFNLSSFHKRCTMILHKQWVGPTKVMPCLHSINKRRVEIHSETISFKREVSHWMIYYRRKHKNNKTLDKILEKVASH